MRSRLLPVVLGLLSLASAGIGVVPQVGQSRVAEATVAVTTPVFSLRRLPSTVTRMVANERLRADVENLLTATPLGSARDAICLAVRDPEGRPVYERQMTTPLIPASTNKLVTGTAALAKLGADTRYTTTVRAAGPAQDGTVGDLWFVGSGDPLLATADYAATAGWLEMPRPATSMEELADKVFNAGVRRVGRVMGDETRYDTQRYIPSWEPYYATNPEVGPQSALTVNDGFAQWRPRAVAAPAPATNAATVLANLLRARGVTVGGVGEGKTPEPTVVVASVDSLPMSEVVAVVLRESDNLAAELLVKELGARFAGAGTTAAGLTVVRTAIADLGLPADGLTAVDGSGLGRDDRVTCGLLQGVLARSGDTGPLAQGLPVAGRTGTLVQRFRATPAAGRVRAKTGSLSEVVGLSGFLTAPDGRSLQFSLVANELPFDSVGAALQDNLVTVLASYPKAPSPEEVAPGPTQPRPPGAG